MQKSTSFNWVREFEIRTAIRFTTDLVNQDPRAVKMVVAGIKRAAAKRVEGESAYEIVRIPSWEPIACVENKYGDRYAVPADILADYILERHERKEVT